MNRILLLAFIFVGLVSFNNCSTILTYDGSVYGGVRSSVSSIGGGRHPHNPFSGITDVLFILDLPFSFILDSILLPITVPVSLRKYFLQKKYKKNAPLFEAASNNDVAKLSDLLSKGHDINSIEDDNKITLVMKAAYSGSMDALKFLIENKADIHAVTTNNENALDFSVQNKQEDAYKLLMSHNLSILNPSIVLQATYSGNEYALFDLLNKKPNAIEQKGYGKNLAMLAMESIFKDESIIKLIDKIGLHEKDEEGYSLIHHAVKNDRFKIIDFLISKNVPIDIIEKDDETPILLAVKEDKLDMVRYLISKKANIRSKANQSILLQAAYTQNKEIFEYLMQNKADINQPIDEDGNTILHEYVKWNYYSDSCLDVINLFLKYKINKAIKNKEGKTAYDLLSEEPEVDPKIIESIKP